MCANLLRISKYLGSEISLEVIYPELIEQVDDEEQEVKIIAIRTYAKFVELVFSKDFNQS